VRYLFVPDIREKNSLFLGLSFSEAPAPPNIFLKQGPEIGTLSKGKLDLKYSVSRGLAAPFYSVVWWTQVFLIFF